MSEVIVEHIENVPMEERGDWHWPLVWRVRKGLQVLALLRRQEDAYALKVDIEAERPVATYE